MSTIQSDPRFFGINLRALWRDVCEAWSDAQNSALLSWLNPAAPVAVLHSDGTQSLWWGDTLHKASGKSGKVRFAALELPEDMVLRRSLSLPAVSEADAASAVELQTRAMSPFAIQDLAWGYRVRQLAGGGGMAEIALASRRQITDYIQAQVPRLGAVSQPEIWVAQPAAAPIVLKGYGEPLRKAQEDRWRRVGYSLIILAGAIVVTMAVTPSLQLRARALEASAAHGGAVHRTAPFVKDREALMQSVEKLGALNEMLAGRIEPLRVLNQLTQALPDDTALQSFSLKDQKVTLAGLTANASALMRVLGEQAGVRDVRAPSPAMRIGGDASKENFVIEFMLDPQAFGVVSATPAAASVTMPAISPQPEPVAAPSAGNIVSPALPPLRATPANPGAAPGLAPSFGGGATRPSPPTGSKPARAASDSKGAA